MKEQDLDKRRLNIVRYGLMVIPPVAWAVAFAPLFMLTNGLGMNWINDALIPSLIEAIVVAVVCVAVYYIYKRAILPRM